MEAFINTLLNVPYIEYALMGYFILISVISVIVCIHDKVQAKKRRARVPEATLLGLGALGGAFFMLVTMLIIRHKTKHAKFMVGLPLIIFLHTVLIFAALWQLK